LEARSISRALLEERILPSLEAFLPMVADAIFGHGKDLQSLDFDFSPHEPAVNIYTQGGDFQRHTDKCALTVNVLLSEPGAFEGGGTTFWPEEIKNIEGPAALATSFDGGSQAVQKRGATALYPCQATALLFSGTVEHAGRAVLAGTRHVFVASFHLCPRRRQVGT
jgi:hypothetical protein